jgi:tetratricopeptide (TPR) repeat protein
MQADAAVQAANAGNWTSALAPARAAAGEDPDVMPYLFTEGLAAAQNGQHAEAAQAFQVVATKTDYPEAWLDLAAEQALLGRPQEAAASITAALRVGRQRPAVAIAAGDLALRIGDVATAQFALASAIVENPSFAGDPWWRLSPQQTIAPGVFAQALRAMAPAYQWQVALVTGDEAGARSEAGDDPAAQQVIAAWYGDAAATAALLNWCQAHPLDLPTLAWCARVQGHLGNVADANRWRAIANTIVGGAYSSGAELRVDPNTVVGRTGEGDPALFWAPYGYLRYAPWDILVPSLLHLTIE